MIESSLYAYLSGETTITDITSRIYPHLMPQGAALPAVTYRVISRPHEHHTEGSAGAARARIQIDSWANTLLAATTLAEAIRLKLQGFSGDMEGTHIGSVTLDNEAIMTELEEGTEFPIYHVASDFMFLYSVEKPSF